MGTWKGERSICSPSRPPRLYNRPCHLSVLDAGIGKSSINPLASLLAAGSGPGPTRCNSSAPIVMGVQSTIHELSYSSWLSGSEHRGFTVADEPERHFFFAATGNYIHLFENMSPSQIDDVAVPRLSCSRRTKAFILQTDDYYRFVFA